ncbi:MAG: ABC transporter substrate-binding protein [Pseudomonadota bacterium]
MMLIKRTLVSLAAAAMVAAPSFADAVTEDYVRQNANDVLAALTAPGVSTADRRVQFQQYIEQFTDIDQVAKQNLTKTYVNSFSEEEMTEYLAAFRAYALAVYEDYFDQYKGEGIEVLGSIDRNARISIVKSKVTGTDGEPLEVNWFVVKHKDRYLVMDLGLKLNGQTIWLLAEQQAQFKSILSSNNGSAAALIDRINQQTADLVAKRADAGGEVAGEAIAVEGESVAVEGNGEEGAPGADAEGL